MSLLVCGFAGAFCFRVEPVPVDAPDPAAAAEVEDTPPAAGPPPEPVKVARNAAGRPARGVTENEEPEVQAAPRAKRRKPKQAAGPPPPVPAVGPPPVAVAAAVPAELPAAEPAPPADPPVEPPGPRTYVIAPGDTLTGIAERELGSHRRFREIFEANRDVLVSPDAIRVGMELRLPGRETL